MSPTITVDLEEMERMLSLDTPADLLISPLDHPLLALRPRTTVYRWLLDGRIETLKIGGLFFTTDAAVKEFLIACNDNPIRKPRIRPSQTDRKAEVALAMARFSSK